MPVRSRGRATQRPKVHGITTKDGRRIVTAPLYAKETVLLNGKYFAIGECLNDDLGEEVTAQDAVNLLNAGSATFHEEELPFDEDGNLTVENRHPYVDPDRVRRMDAKSGNIIDADEDYLKRAMETPEGEITIDDLDFTEMAEGGDVGGKDTPAEAAEKAKEADAKVQLGNEAARTGKDQVAEKPTACGGKSPDGGPCTRPPKPNGFCTQHQHLVPGA